MNVLITPKKNPLPAKALILDRDGVINLDRGYVSKPADFRFVHGAVEAMQLFQKAGYQIVVVTNQSGIARGFYTEQDYEVLTRHMQGELMPFGVYLKGIYHCPHLPDAAVEAYRKNCNCRKPRPGMILRAVLDHGIDLSQSILVGDKESDIAAGRAAGVRTCYLVAADPTAASRESMANGVFTSLKAIAEHLFSNFRPETHGHHL